MAAALSEGTWLCGRVEEPGKEEGVLAGDVGWSVIHGSPNGPVRACPPQSLPSRLDPGGTVPVRAGVGQNADEGGICP